MTTFSALTTLDGHGDAVALSEALEALDPSPYGVGVFEIEDGSGRWEVGAYFMERPSEISLELLAAAFSANAFAVSEIANKDWVSEVRRDLAPVAAGRFLVHGSHDRAAASGKRHALEIEAAMAFGTGHHGTTRGCLNALDHLLKIGLRPGHVADIGCGTGVLAMAAASVLKCRCLASDLDPVAIATAKANFSANRLTPFGQIVCAPGFRAPAIRTAAPFDLVLANILARPLKRLAPDMARHTRPGGFIILSGILNEQCAGVEAIYKGWAFRREWIGVDGDWSTLVMRRC